MMKQKSLLLVLFACLQVSLCIAQSPIRIETKHIDLVYQVLENGRLSQSYLGDKLLHVSDVAVLDKGVEAFPTHGMEDYYEPAFHVEHNDGLSSLDLKYVSHETKSSIKNVKETIICLKDEVYPVQVLVHYLAYYDLDIIKTYTEISHSEKKPIVLHKYASSMLHLKNRHYFLTQFTGNHAEEVREASEELHVGKKVLDSKLGSRADMFISPFFQISLGEIADENKGEVLMGTLGWTGNFRFNFEVDHRNRLRIITGINPYFSSYCLKPDEVFRTPDFIFTYSNQGKGRASRNFHDWAREYQLNHGKETRMTLLNNWEATFFNFNEEKLVSLMDDAVKLGVDMFLLDDGWFGNKYPRKDDHQGLGDWKETADKLPNGVKKLVDAASERGIKFGIWIEPEMVNPKSELYEHHKDWIIHQPNREEYYFRHQLVLDLSNPKVQDYVFSIVDELLTKYPQIAYFKWDCNSPITNIHSCYLKDKQSHLYIDYVRGLYKVLERIKTKYPRIPMMLCSGGGGRTDYEALRYFTEFWPSDNTDPVERLYIQWGYSQFFPVKALCAHVTSMNTQASIKFRTDVAMMGKLGFDINISELSAHELAYCQQAVKNYNRLKPVILDGDQYRLISPYKDSHTATQFVSKDRKHAVLFAFDIYPRFRTPQYPVLLQGLDPMKRYVVQEINLENGKQASSRIYSGDYLMKVGLNVFTADKLRSKVVEIKEQQ